MINILKRNFSKCEQVNKYYNFFKRKIDEKTFEKVEKIQNKTMTLSLYMTKSFREIKNEDIFNNYYLNSLSELNENLKNKKISKLSDFEILKDLVLDYKKEEKLTKIEQEIFETGKKILQEKNYLLKTLEKKNDFNFINFEDFSKEEIEEKLNLKKLAKKARGWKIDYNLEKKTITIKNEKRNTNIKLVGFSEKQNFEDFVDFQLELKAQKYEIDNLVLDYPIFYSEKNKILDQKNNSQKFIKEEDLKNLQNDEDLNLDIDFNPDYKLKDKILSSFLSEDILNMNKYILDKGFFYINCLNKPLYFNFMSNLVASFIQDGKRHVDTVLTLSDLHLQEIMQFAFFTSELQDFWTIWDLNQFVNIVEDVKFLRESRDFGCFSCQDVQKKLIPKFFAFDLFKKDFFSYKEDIMSKLILEALSQKKDYNLITVINQDNIFGLLQKILKMINQQNIMGTTFYNYNRKAFLDEKLGDIPINTDMYKEENIEKKIILESLAGEKYKKNGHPNENQIFIRYRQTLKHYYNIGLESLLDEKSLADFEEKSKGTTCGSVGIVFSNLDGLVEKEVKEGDKGYSGFDLGEKEGEEFKLPEMKIKEGKMKFKVKKNKKKNKK